MLICASSKPPDNAIFPPPHPPPPQPITPTVMAPFFLQFSHIFPVHLMSWGSPHQPSSSSHQPLLLTPHPPGHSMALLSITLDPSAHLTQHPARSTLLGLETPPIFLFIVIFYGDLLNSITKHVYTCISPLTSIHSQNVKFCCNPSSAAP